MFFSFIYNSHQQRQMNLQLVLQKWLIFLHMPIPESRGIFSEIHSPITTLEITYIIALILQPIRCFLPCSGETGTRLTTAIHRRLSLFSEGRGASVHRLTRTSSRVKIMKAKGITTGNITY